MNTYSIIMQRKGLWQTCLPLKCRIALAKMSYKQHTILANEMWPRVNSIMAIDCLVMFSLAAIYLCMVILFHQIQTGSYIPI
jgi:hypothetical protein